MRGMDASRVRIFGVAVLLYGLFMLVESSINYFNKGQSTSDLCLAIGGLVMTVGGLYVIIREDEDKMDAIGVYAITYGIFKMFRAYGTGGDFWIIPFVMAIPFIFMGYRYLTGTAKSVISNIIWSVVYIFVDIFQLIFRHDIINLVDIFILVMFISVLISRDVWINTTTGKKVMAAKYEIKGKFDADVDLAKDGIDAIGEGLRNGLDAGVEKFDESLEEHKERVEKVEEGAEEAKKKKYYLNRETNTFEEKK